MEDEFIPGTAVCLHGGFGKVRNVCGQSLKYSCTLLVEKHRDQGQVSEPRIHT